MKPLVSIVAFVLLFSLKSSSQCIPAIQHLGDLPSLFTQNTLTARKDNTGRPFLYVASKEGGLKIADITNPAAPLPIDTIPTSAFNGYHVISLTQSGNLLYLALGNINDVPAQGAAMAVVDVTNPYAPVITDTWYSAFSSGGCGAVEVEGPYAYLGGMYHGLIILDISDANNVTWVSTYLPSMSFPHGPPVTHADSVKFNIRGLAVRNDTVYACFDRGGVRVIDATIKSSPVQIAQYCNPALIGFATAYNNIVLNQGLAYVAADYQGIEVLDISAPGTVSAVGAWKGPDWPAPTNNFSVWGNAPGHANELRYDPQNQCLFVATGKSDLHVIDVSVPAQPDSCSFYGGVNNNRGTWGLDVNNDTIYLAYIVTVLPFQSNWTGIQLLSYSPANTGFGEMENEGLRVSPNPARSSITIHLPDGESLNDLQLFNMNGREIANSLNASGTEWNIESLQNGIYLIKITARSGRMYQRKLLVMH